MNATSNNHVKGPAAQRTSVQLRVFIAGQRPDAAHGIDVDDQGNHTVTEQRLYELIRQPKSIADRRFEIEFLIRPWRLLRSRSADPRRRLRMATIFDALVMGTGQAGQALAARLSSHGIKVAVVAPGRPPTEKWRQPVSSARRDQ